MLSSRFKLHNYSESEYSARFIGRGIPAGHWLLLPVGTDWGCSKYPHEDVKTGGVLAPLFHPLTMCVVRALSGRGNILVSRGLLLYCSG